MILPGATLGLLGGGQLGRMFALRARSMGYRVVVLDPDPLSPAGAVADRHLCAAYLDTDALAELAAESQVVTTEFENVPAEAMRYLASRVPVRPSPEAVETTQDRIREKSFLKQAGLATAPFHAMEKADDLKHAWEKLDEVVARGEAPWRPPFILKTARLGYDGKGQAVVHTLNEALAAFQRFGSVSCVLERKLALEREVSVVLARGEDGVVVPFPVGENVHVNGILDTSVVPARVSDTVAREAISIATRVAESLGYVGVLGVELFVTAGGRLWVNELAPRPHNTGHYTLEACVTDQFEQQVRAVCGLPLGSGALLRPAAMANLLGDVWAHGEPKWNRALAIEGTTLHLYGKREPRAGRKMGHLTTLAETPDTALERVLVARQALSH